MDKEFKFKAENYTILIVESSKVINNTLNEEFTNLGYNCFSCFSLKDTYNIIENYEIHYILIDVNLSGGNGYNLIDKFEYTSTGIFVLCRETDNSFKEKIYKKGIIDFITKNNSLANKVQDISKQIIQLERNRLKTILIIAESKVLTEQVKMLLTPRHYEIIILNDILTTIDDLLEKKIDLIFIGDKIHNYTSIEFLETYYSQIVEQKKIPVLIISDNVNLKLIRDGLKAGAVEILKRLHLSEELILKANFWIDYKQKEEDVIKSTLLLKQYKETVDRSSIVSKTDASGIITYVNDQFCKTSGYSEEELLGKSHKILRHPATSPNVFRTLWHTIKVEKKPWKHIIKNRNKDGNDFWIDAVINPILDEEDNVLEYIAINYDITNSKKIQNFFKTQLNSSTKSLTESMNLSKEYERAMNESSIVSRADLKGTITFVNFEFCKISGYTEEELLGKNHNIVRHEDMKREVFKEMWITIRSGKTWKGVVKNKTKSGKNYWVDSTIVPIKDIDGNIIEYMGIRTDLTSLFNLHKEVEYTQKEIIYRMGEIGETRSKETGNHVKRVASYSKVLAIAYGLSEEEVNILFTASPMHDIGKVGIPDSILKKAGKLTDEEFIIMKTHADIGFNILKGSERNVLQAAAIVSREHHEKWNGKGYPRGLKAENIHIYGRITAIADVFDALGSDRVYKKAWDDEKVFNLLKEEKGEHFDPMLINLFFRNLDEILEIREKYKD